MHENQGRPTPEVTLPTLAIDFGGTQIKAAVAAGGQLLATGQISNRSEESDLAATAEMAQELILAAGVAPRAAGIAMPGVISPGGRSLLAAHGKYGYAQGLDIAGWAEETWGIPAIVENDGRASLIGEMAHGCASGHDDVVMVILGTGIGSAAAMGGRVLRGRTGHAGILGGHVTVGIDGPRCPCGNTGCAEALASTWALRGYVLAHPGFNPASVIGSAVATGSLGYAEIVAERESDPVAASAFDRAIEVWGAATVTLCHAYDPAAVVLSGGVARAGSALRDGIAQWVGANLWSSATRPVFLTPRDANSSVLLGLSHLAGSLP